MRALLLCAGLGKRLRPLTHKIPKCMVEINGRPLIDIWLKKLCQMGIKEVLINLHYLPNIVERHLVRHSYPIKISTVYEKKLLGTAGTLKKNNCFFKNQPILLIHADNLSEFDGQKFMDTFWNRQKHIEITMMTFKTDSPESCGVLELSKEGNVIKFHEKVINPPTRIANAAVYILSGEVLNYLKKIRKYQIDFSIDIIPNFMNKINTFHNEVYHRDIGTIKSLEKAQNEFKNILI